MASDFPRPKAVIVDMDGTLCDVRSVRHFVEPPPGVEGFKRNFHAFHSASLECPAHQPVIDLLDHCRGAGLKVLVVSAREARWGFLTALWLREHDIAYDEMLLRHSGDYRSDVEVKQEIAKQLLERFQPVLAIDDRYEVIEVWHSYGIPTVQIEEDGTPADLMNPAGTTLTECSLSSQAMVAR
jgi:beta-phosphoglucomutase-like phosphatase (HAD superfamily)